MKTRRIDVIVTGCGRCPYACGMGDQCNFDTICTASKDKFSLGHEVCTNMVHENCPLPEEEMNDEKILREALGLDPNTSAGVACCDDEDTKFSLYCAQMAVLNGIPTEWLDTLIISEGDKVRLQEVEDEMIERMLNECGVDFNMFEQMEE